MKTQAIQRDTGSSAGEGSLERFLALWIEEGEAEEVTGHFSDGSGPYPDLTPEFLLIKNKYLNTSGSET